MKLSRFIAYASVALMLPFGLAQATTLNAVSPGSASPNSHPSFSVIEDRTLNLRETASQLVVETVEDALRAGGVALLGEGFQIDSSLGWVFGEDITSIDGGIDAALPLLNKNGHVIFTQPGLVFWEGHGEEERIDANFGIVYRTDLANTPIGIDAIGGVSLFYDYDFHRVGHERISIGADVQTDNFHGAFNYYHPLSNEEDGREGFVEEPLKGVDLRVALERSWVRAGARVGLWRFDGGEEIADDWRSSVGFDAGYRIIPGVFFEADWEKHQEDFALDQRFKLGLAFRFSLPGFEGQSYAGGSKSTDLYKIVDREKRILYEERESGPRVSIVRTGSESVGEGDMLELDIQLNEALDENVTINLVGSGAATYGEISDGGDWLLDNGNGNCDSVQGTDCQVTITTGETGVSGVMIAINDDGRTDEPPEDIVLSMEIESTGDTDLMIGAPFTFTIPADPPLPTVNLSSSTNIVEEGDTATITLTLNEDLPNDATFNLIAGEAGATYGTDWNLSVGGVDCNTASETSPCQVTITQGRTTAEVTLEANSDSTLESPSETVTVSVEVDSGSVNIVTGGSSTSLNFTIQDPPTISISYDGSQTVASHEEIRMRIDLNRAITQPITVNMTHTGNAPYHAGGAMGGAWELWYNPVPPGEEPPDEFILVGNISTICADITPHCSIPIPAGQTTVDIEVVTSGLSSGLTIILAIAPDGPSMNLVELGTSSIGTLTVQ
ncbi:MAG: inverse autotransporter beta domain-containing protein [Hyphomicrobiales bacterium]|nr:inverse autotransporter beta domain-containing protein [Hyphomicrobiales bacterium]MCY4038545.1 inverse autotransporter beta domain-containing protein [Hyphomicrobiales bacterium]